MLRPWGPCPYHLHPRNQSPWTPPPEPLYPPPPHRVSFKKTSFFFFFLYALETSKIRRKLRNLLRPWGPCPYHLPPPAPKPLDPPPSPSLGPRGGPRGLLFSVWGPTPSLKLPSSPYAPPPTLSCNQGPWFTALSTRPAPVGTPPPHSITPGLMMKADLSPML